MCRSFPLEESMTRMLSLVCVCAVATFCAGSVLRAQTNLDQRIDKEKDSLVAIYKHIHQNPALSTEEKETSALLAGELRRLGFEVTEHVGKYDVPDKISYGVVGVLRNGPGPTVMVRTELDALPVEEKTDLAYASKVVTKNDAGDNVYVMHACGHDIHMTSWVGAATMRTRSKDRWRGTVMRG